MPPEGMIAFGWGLAAGLAAGAVPLIALLRGAGRPAGPKRTLALTAVRFALTLLAAGLLALLLERPATVRAFLGLALAYGLLLVIETWWATAQARRAGAVEAAKRRSEVGQ